MPTLNKELGKTIFGRDVSLYAKARPEYPNRIYKILLERCKINPQTHAFEIGPGTGQATERLLSAGLGRLLTLEPDQRLARFLSENLALAHTNLEVQATAFEDATLADASFDLAVAATSFHWLEPAVALPKILRALRPGGWWAMWWNVYADPEMPDEFYLASQPLFSQLARSPAEDTGVRQAFALDHEVRRAELAQAGFERIEHEVIHWTTILSTEQMLALSATFSPVAELADADRQHFLNSLASMVEDCFAGSVKRNFVSVIYSAQKPR
jgi:SAM-dependent methyltransferase